MTERCTQLNSTQLHSLASSESVDKQTHHFSFIPQTCNSAISYREREKERKGRTSEVDRDTHTHTRTHAHTHPHTHTHTILNITEETYINLTALLCIAVFSPT